MIVSYTLASLIIPLITAFLPSWQILAFIAAASVLPVLLSWRLVPESPSWLLVKGKQEEALQQLQTIAKWNKTDFQLDDAKNELDGLLRHDVNTTEEEKTSLLQMFLNPNLQINASLC